MLFSRDGFGNFFGVLEQVNANTRKILEVAEAGILVILHPALPDGSNHLLYPLFYDPPRGEIKHVLNLIKINAVILGID